MNNVEKALVLRQLIEQYGRESVGERAPKRVEIPGKHTISASSLIVGYGRLPELERQIEQLKRELTIGG